MAVLHTEQPGHSDDFHIIELTSEEYAAAKARALLALGLTYEQLKAQAEHREFSSPDARALWLRIKPV